MISLIVLYTVVFIFLFYFCGFNILTTGFQPTYLCKIMVLLNPNLLENLSNKTKELYSFVLFYYPFFIKTY